MDRDELLRTLKGMLEEDRGENLDTIEEHAKLRDDLGLDSVDMVTLVMQVQDRFRVVLSNDELTNIVTVSDLLDLLHGKLVQSVQAA